MDNIKFIANFIEGWNNHSPADTASVKFKSFWPEGCWSERPERIIVRFNPESHKSDAPDVLSRLQNILELRSQGLLRPMVSPEMFEKGILVLEVDQTGNRYTETKVVSALKWLGEIFFPNLS